MNQISHAGVCIGEPEALRKDLGIKVVGLHLVRHKINGVPQPIGDGFVCASTPHLQFVGGEKVLNRDEAVGSVEFNLLTCQFVLHKVSFTLNVVRLRILSSTLYI